MHLLKDCTLSTSFYASLLYSFGTLLLYSNIHTWSILYFSFLCLSVNKSTYTLNIEWKKQGLMLSGHGNLILHTDVSLPKSFSRLATCPGCTPSVPVTAKICSCSSCSSEWDHQQSLFTNNRVFVVAIGAGNLCESETNTWSTLIEVTNC